MPTLLWLDSSADLTGSRSRAVTKTFADEWRARGPEYTVVRRDLHAEQLPHLADPALHWPPQLRAAGANPPAEQEALQHEIIDELVAADVVVVGAPMYNYSMPSTLKAWIDYIHVPAVTTPFGDVDAQPMKGKAAVVVSARGGSYDAGTPTEGWDHVVPPLQIILGNALGMDVEVITTSRTLAETVPAMSAEIDRSRDELASAHEAAAAAARRL
jgi:FMN-dependent NADH-azoreductase